MISRLEKPRTSQITSLTKQIGIVAKAQLKKISIGCTGSLT
jgi:hypothetical protein